MAYADRNVAGSRVVAIVVVAVLVAVLGYVFVTGLAMKYIKEKTEELDVFDVQDPPPPPEEVPPPPPPPDSPVPPPPTQVVTPPAVVQVPVPAPPIQSTNVPQPQPPTSPPAPPAPPAPPQPPAPPAPPRVAKKLTPRGQPQSWVTNDDYPAAALRSESEGTTGVRLDVDASGKVSNCTVTSSSGSSLLDNTACSLLRRRARFNPAEDASGNKIPASWPGRFTWKMPTN
ncbi:MAG: energy transducer TonB [Rhizorhabdus sp.]